MIEFEKALQKFLDEYLTLCEKLHTNRQEKMLLDKNSPYNILKQALAEFKIVKEVNPSEALKDLKVIENNIIYTLSDCDINDEVCQNLQYAKTKIPVIEQVLLNAQETNELVEEYDLKPYELREALLLYAMYKGEYNGKPLPSLKQYKEQEKENAEYKKALEIIKEKCVNIWFLMSSHTVIDYNTRIKELDDSDKFILTPKEFILLKNILIRN